MGEMSEFYERFEDYGSDTDLDATVEFEGVEVIRTTEKALLCVIDGAEHWIPKSQLLNCDPELDGRLVIPEWLAEKKGLST